MIDWTRVKDLHEEVGSRDFEEVVTLFIDEVETALGRLDGDPTREDLHFLKGSALNLGFAALAQACRDGADATTLRRCFADSTAQLRAELPERLAA